MVDPGSNLVVRRCRAVLRLETFSERVYRVSAEAVHRVNDYVVAQSDEMGESFALLTFSSLLVVRHFFRGVYLDCGLVGWKELTGFLVTF